MKHIAEWIHTDTVTTAARYPPFAWTHASKMPIILVKCTVNDTLAHAASKVQLVCQ